MHTFRRSAALLALTVGSVASLPALAADELHYNQISLRAEVSTEVARDQMIVTLYTEEQNTDPAKLAAAYDGPIFVGQGATDIQVSVADAEAIKAAQPRADLVIWDGVNHVLKTAPADRAAVEHGIAAIADRLSVLVDGAEE